MRSWVVGRPYGTRAHFRAGLNRPGIGIHSSPAPYTIGRAGSHGCIRLSNWDAATFYTLVGKGTAVTVR